MTERTVQLGMTTYTDVNGQRRIGLAGEKVDVAVDDVERFDRVNGGAPEGSAAPKKAAPKKRAARRRT
jgi:hypothetical protein